MPKAAQYKPRLYESPLKLRQRTVGEMSIERYTLPVGYRVDIVGLRQGILRGVAPVCYHLKRRRVVHRLVSTTDGLWMTDLPEELNQIHEMLWNVRPRGHVVVGGLGLGILPALLARESHDVKTIRVIERSSDVISLCRRDGVGYAVFNADIRDWIQMSEVGADCYLLDTWQGTSENTWWEEVLPLRRLIRQQHGPRPVIHCWAEDIMVTQVFRALTTYTEPHWWYSHLPIPMSARDAQWFLLRAGTPQWEQRYGKLVDQYGVPDRDYQLPPLTSAP